MRLSVHHFPDLLFIDLDLSLVGGSVNPNSRDKTERHSIW